MAMIDGMSLLNLSPQGSGSKQKRKNCKNQRWWMIPRKQQNWYTYELTETDSKESLYKFKSGKILVWEEEVDTKSPLTKKLFVTDSCWEWESQFSPMQCHWATNHTLGQAPCPAVVTQQKMKSVVFVFSVCVCVCVWTSCFVLVFIVFLMFYFNFFVLIFRGFVVVEIVICLIFLFFE